MNILIMAGITIAAVMILLSILSEFLVICEPYEVLVLSGGRFTDAAGSKQGYRVIFGGRTFRIPFLETIDRLDMRIMPIEIKVTNAYSEGGIPLDIRAIAMVKVSSDPRLIGNAIERFQGMPRAAIERVAKETLEGNLRGVLATMTPEEVNEDRLKFSELIQTEVHRDLNKLGLEVDTLKIQNVHDTVDYLESMSRAAIARVQKEAAVAESDAKRTADSAAAQAEATTRVAQQKADLSIATKQNELSAVQSQLQGEISSEVERTDAAGREAFAQAERRLQEIRTALEALRLQAEVVLPAEARQEAERLRAAGEASLISERGRATADAFQMLAEVWASSNGDARDIFMMEKLDGILKDIVKQVGKVRTKQVTLIDSGDGSTLPSYVAAYPAIVGSMLKELQNTLGIDLKGALRTNNSSTPVTAALAAASAASVGAGRSPASIPGSSASDDSLDLTGEQVFTLVAREMAREGRLDEGKKTLLPALAQLLLLPASEQERAVAAAASLEADPAPRAAGVPLATPEALYAKAYFLAIKDRMLSKKEKQVLGQLAAALKLPDEVLRRIEARIQTHAGARPVEA